MTFDPTTPVPLPRPRRSTRQIRRILACVVPFALLSVAALWFQQHYRFGLNLTQSLHGTLFLIHKGEPATRGDYVAFRWHGGGPYPAGSVFVKQLVGVPGDTISREGQRFHVNGRHVGTAKTISQAGQPLDPGPTGVLPPGRYYVSTPHPDSLDSRYAITGWIAQRDLIGRAHALF